MDAEEKRTHDELIDYQTLRIRDLLEQILECCLMRTAYLSSRFGIPQAELRCLMLFRGERYLTVKGIAQKLDVAKSRVTKIVDGLERKHLVNRIPDPEDARFKLISLTREGREKAEEIEELNQDIHRALLLDLGPESRKTVMASLEALRSSMESVKQGLV